MRKSATSAKDQARTSLSRRASRRRASWAGLQFILAGKRGGDDEGWLVEETWLVGGL